MVALLLSKLYILLITLLLTVACDDFDAPQQDSENPTPANITIAELSRLIGEKSITISQPLRIGGYITTSDRESNFYKTILIEDETLGAEIMAGIYGLHTIYPQGYYLNIELSGCAVGRHYGVLQIGLPAKEYSGYPTDYFASRVLLDRHISRHNIYKDIEPQSLTVAQLDASLCGKLVRIEKLLLTSHLYPEVWKVNLEGSWHGYNFFSTAEGDTIVVYTSDYATYAEDVVPQNMVSITGILQYGTINGREYFMIKMRSKEDCMEYEM